MRHETKEFWLAALRADGPAFLGAARVDGALTAPVPSCPEWTVADLTRHLGSVYAWVRGHVERRVLAAPEPRGASPEIPDTDVLDWWETEFQALLGVLDNLSPDVQAWNWAPQAKVASFWHRRMAQETSVHRWDAQLAIGLGEPLDAKLAADGVSEVLDSWLPAGRRTGPVNRTGVVQLIATDVEQRWYVRLRGEGVALLDTDTLLDTDDPQARVLARGTASDLDLALWGRVPFDVLELAGDATLLESLRAG